ncbi:arsenate reductase/protein-tyrosine-phosphatase family protein [Fundicoccus culcitae]
MKKVLYFLCTSNSARSQIAEGLAKYYLGDEYDIYSAGIEVGVVNPYAVQVMDEIGIDISDQTSKVIDVRLFQSADIVVTLCKDAYERCPNVPPRSKHIHWGLEDPAKVVGTDEEIHAAFVKTRDSLHELIKAYVKDGITEDTNFINREDTFYPQRDNFGAVMREIREENGLSLEDAAEKIGVNVNFLKRAESDEAVPSKYFVHAFADVMKESYDEVLDRLYVVG